LIFCELLAIYIANDDQQAIEMAAAYRDTRPERELWSHDTLVHEFRAKQQLKAAIQAK
jgi:hypothetical protein